MPPDYFGKVVIDHLPFLLDGLRLTIELSVKSSLIALIMGTVIAIFRVQPLSLLRAFAVAYVEFFRNIPLLILLFFFYHGLPKAGLSLSGEDSAMWGLAIYTAAFVAETVRAGILSINKGQMEAARSLGFSYTSAMRYIILPQAFSIIVPPLGSLFIALIKNSSLAATIAVPEILYQGEVLDGRTFRTMEILSAVGLFYLALTLPLGYLVNILEQRLGRSTAATGRTGAQFESPGGTGGRTGWTAPLSPLGKALMWPLVELLKSAGWLLQPLGWGIGWAVETLSDRPRLGQALQWLLYATAGLAALVWLVPYLLRVFTTEEGLRPWLAFTDGRTWLFLWEGVLVTVKVALISIIASLVIGTLFALGRLSRIPLIRWPSIGYIEIVRALPVFLMIIMVHLQFNRISAGLGFSLSEDWAVILALVLYTVSVNAEIVRAGILSIDRGQTEAARSLGLTYWQMMRYVILPQALQRMIPPLVSQFITLLKDTSLGAVIGLLELLRRAEIIYRGQYTDPTSGRIIMNNNPIESFLVVSVIYFIMCYALSLVSARMEGRWAKAR